MMTQENTKETPQGKVAASYKRSTDLKRELEGAPPYDKENLTTLVNILTNINSSFVGVQGALGVLTSVIIGKISPDGKLGGRGYVMAIREMKEDLTEMQNMLSNMRDTVMDEFNNPNWGLSKDEKDEIISLKERVVGDTEKSLDEVDKELERLLTEYEGDEGQEDEGEGDEEFPEMPEPQEDPEPLENEEGTPTAEENPALSKKASSSNKVFIGMRDNSSAMAKVVASKVLEGLVKRASEKGTQKNSVGEQ